MSIIEEIKAQKQKADRDREAAAIERAEEAAAQGRKLTDLLGPAISIVKAAFNREANGVIGTSVVVGGPQVVGDLVSMELRVVKLVPNERTTDYVFTVRLHALNDSKATLTRRAQSSGPGVEVGSESLGKALGGTFEMALEQAMRQLFTKAVS